MRKTFSHIVLLSLALCYVLSTMGYGIHHCEHDGTSNVVLCYGESPCERSHEHGHCDKDHVGKAGYNCNSWNSGSCCPNWNAKDELCENGVSSESSNDVICHSCESTNGNCSCKACKCVNGVSDVSDVRDVSDECEHVKNCGEYHHSSKCCHTSIFRISNEQVMQDVIRCPEAGVYLLAYLPEQPFMNGSSCGVDFICGRIPAPPLITGNSINVINSQFRI